MNAATVATISNAARDKILAAVERDGVWRRIFFPRRRELVSVLLEHAIDEADVTATIEEPEHQKGATIRLRYWPVVLEWFGDQPASLGSVDALARSLEEVVRCIPVSCEGTETLATWSPTWSGIYGGRIITTWEPKVTHP